MRWQISASVMAIGCIVLGFSGTMRAGQQPQPDLNRTEGAQVLTQGPIHEAFAEPVLYDPKPGPVIPKAPPAPVTESPPDQKPVGDNVQWIPGYWAWDDTRNDFIWVSGIWRNIPPGRQWIPGYWRQVEGGYQWVPGYWSTTDATEVQYLPEPPASLENGANSPPPTAEATWMPGMWAWQDNQYAWRPGFWVNNQPGWMWTPASYSWTPSGYVFNPGYWDYPLANRGIPFAPVYFGQQSYAQPGLSYTPGVGLLTSALLSSLFVRPSYGSYYFGDYYAPNNFQSGIYPFYAFHGSRYGYDPLFANAAAQNLRTNPGWANDLQEIYRYRRDHPEARPPRTFAETRTMTARPVAGQNLPRGVSNLELARPLSQITTPAAGAVENANAMRFERIDQARRQELGRQAAQLHKFGADRSRRELEAGRVTPPTGLTMPRQVEAPRSPIGGPLRAAQQPAVTPAPPRHPEFDRATRPATPGPAPLRYEPHPEMRPVAPSGAPGYPAAPSPRPYPEMRPPTPSGAPGHPAGRSPRPGG
jgi:hypothetical protein